MKPRKKKDSNAMEIVKGLFAGNSGILSQPWMRKNIILVKELKAGEDYKDMKNTARMILDMLNSEAMSNAYIAYGTIVHTIKRYLTLL